MGETTTNKLKQKLTVRVDLGDRTSRCCILDPDGEVLEESSLPTTQAAFRRVRRAGRRAAFERAKKGRPCGERSARHTVSRDLSVR